MNDTQTNESGHGPDYRLAETYNEQPVTKTTSHERTSRAIDTSQTQGTLKTIIVNKPGSGKVIDKSTA